MESKNWKIKLGIILVIFSCILFLSLPLIPFLQTENKVTITTVTFIIAEITFWSGGILLGKELFSKYKSYLNPKNWFTKRVN